MNKKISTLILGAFALVGLYGCSNHSDEPNVPPIDATGENTIVELRVADERTMTRAAGTEEENATTDEKAITGTVSILVYNNNGDRETTHTATIADGGTTKFTIKSGQKYFYVVANQDLVTVSPGVIALNRRLDFERQVLNVTFGGTNSDIPSITDPKFIIGTLWGQSVYVPQGGTDANPIKVTLNVGRASAKIKLKSVEKGANSNMLGEFENPFYRLGSIPKTYFHVGQYQGSIVPPSTGHGLVTSAVHTESWGSNVGGNPVQNTAFTNYAVWKNVTAAPTTNFFYGVENTTALDQQKDQYYGNTTYVQLRTKYTPAASEMFDADDLSQNFVPAGGWDGTFYVVVMLNGDRYICPNFDPATHSTMVGLDYALKYTEGLNYHKFPIRDQKETDPEQIHTVLRNHYYDVAVTSIKNLGDWDEKVDPSEPITGDTEVLAEIKVLEWSKITQNEDL